MESGSGNGDGIEVIGLCKWNESQVRALNEIEAIKDKVNDLKD